ncbi:MAG: YicC family protein [Betaproteobacteria bacterium]|nr:YicC family protein [Betaproteobacteria bacterium]MDH3435861.1 YicC family protein [Betaproteobacteria bacterium]
MIYSMTGYASASREFAYGALNLELRSVNHRYLDLQFRLPDDLRSVEPVLRERLAAQLTRGKVECRVTFTAAAVGPRAPQFNEVLLRQLVELNTRVRAALPGADTLAVADILRWPGMLETEALPLEELKAACRELLSAVLVEFTAARAREGEKLAQVLLDRVAGMERLVAAILPRLPQVIAGYQERLATRLKEAIGTGDEERIRQEVAVFATKIDVDEELSRLTAHVAELKRVLAEGGGVGKKLDFLMQELNREANTLASKSADLSVTQAALELKLLVEQMREQIQNIE